jgi:hypothetical protein
MWRNNESILPTRTVACADKDQKFYPFFFLNGRITALSLFGLISPTTHIHPEPIPQDNDAGLCQICYDARANCVFIPCGHVFFCSGCQGPFEQQSAKKCPICRKVYENVFEIEDD